MAQGTCTTGGCGKVGQLRRGMCSKCYGRWKTYGSTEKRYYECPKGHKLSPENIYTDAKGRHCIACRDLREAQPVPACVIEDCLDPQLARGWCRKHYLRWYRLGSTDTPPRFTVKPCSVDTCTEDAVKWGLCVKHHARMKTRGTTDDPPAKPETCSVAGCPRAPCSRGWCKPHYKQLTGQGSAHEMRRYAQKCGSETEPVDYGKILAEFGMVCHLCGGEIETRRDLNMDHVIPLLGGHNGTHTYGNIRPSHRWCNQQKHTKLVAEYLASTGRLSA
jgi:hypothetical protein